LNVEADDMVDIDFAELEAHAVLAKAQANVISASST
jgi:hypothetical protein